MDFKMNLEHLSEMLQILIVSVSKVTVVLDFVYKDHV